MQWPIAAPRTPDRRNSPKIVINPCTGKRFGAGILASNNNAHCIQLGGMSIVRTKLSRLFAQLGLIGLMASSLPLAITTLALAREHAPLGYQIMCLKTPQLCKGGGKAKVGLSNQLMATLKLVSSHSDTSCAASAAVTALLNRWSPLFASPCQPRFRHSGYRLSSLASSSRSLSLRQLGSGAVWSTV